MDARGFSLAEALIALAVISLVVAISASVVGPALARERSRADLQALRSALQEGRIEANSRNRPCRMMVNTVDRRVVLVDTLGTTSPADDVVLRRTTLSSASSFESPDGSDAVSIENLSGPWYAVTFGASGTVEAGTGEIRLKGGDRYGRIAVFAGGGNQLAVWDGGRWRGEGH